MPADIQGVAVEILGTSISVVGLNMQKYAHMARALGEDGSLRQARSTHTQRWLLGFLVFFVGQLTEAVAQAFGSQSLISAVGNVSLVTNCIVATLVFDEPLGRRDVYAMACVIAGSVLAVLTSPELPDEEYNVDYFKHHFEGPVYLVFFCVCCVLLFGSIFLLARLGPVDEQRTNLGGVLYGIVAAVNGSFVVTFSKTTVLLIKESANGDAQFSHPLTYVFVGATVVTAVGNLLCLNLGLARYESLAVISVYKTLNALLCIVAGILFYKTWEEFTPLTSAGFCGAIAVTLAGVWILAQREFDREDARGRFTQNLARLASVDSAAGGYHYLPSSPASERGVPSRWSANSGSSEADGPPPLLRTTTC